MPMPIKKWGIILVMALCINVSGQTILTGNISAIVSITNAGNPYIVEKDIEIPPDKEVEIHEGCIFLFKDFTSLTILGTVRVTGTVEMPVIFTSIHDNRYYNDTARSAALFDWNGIDIKPDAKYASFKNFSVTYSVFGIKSRREDILIEQGQFFNNGQFNLTVMGKILPVKEGIPFSYGVFVPPLTPSSVFNPEIASKLGESSTAYCSFKSISFITDPPAVEFYIDKKPGKKVRADYHTPVVFKKIENRSMRLTFFKEGFYDTTLIINPAESKRNSYNISLRVADTGYQHIQHRLIVNRYKATIGRYCLYSAPVFFIGGTAAFISGWRNYAEMNRAGNYLQKDLAPDSPESSAIRDQYNKHGSAYARQINAGIALSILCTTLVGGGIVLNL